LNASFDIPHDRKGKPLDLRAVIFDCDGVLVDSEPISNRVLAETLTELGFPCTPEESTRRYMGRSWSYVEADVAGRAGGPAPDALAELYRERMLTAFSQELRPVAGVEEALDAIALPACVASSGAPAKIRFSLRHTGLLARFEGRLFSVEEVEHGKPAPDLFVHAAARMGWDPAHTAVVEDSPLGVEAGVAAGMVVFGYAGSVEAEELEAAGASAVFFDMAELPGLLAPS
jgi:HAD superfamily hydrolase (TIGR01509 family)